MMPPTCQDDAVTQAVKDQSSNSIEHRRQTIVSLLGRDAQVEEKVSASWVWLAASTGQVEILEVLVTCGIKLNARDETGKSALDRLLVSENVSSSDEIHRTVTILLQHHPDFSQAFSSDRWLTALISPSSQGQTAVVKALLECVLPRMTMERRIKMLAAKQSDETSLQKAALGCHANVVELLLKHGANPECKSWRRWTPLLHASYAGSENIVGLLLGDRNPGITPADVNYRAPQGFTALGLAALAGKKAVIERLLQVPSINVDLRDRSGIPALLTAAANDNYDIVDLLKSRYAPSSLPESRSRACGLYQARVSQFSSSSFRLRRHDENVAAVLEAIADKRPFPSTLPFSEYGLYPDSTEFIWLHFPANNVAWIECALARLCTKNGPMTVDGYKLLLQLLADQNLSSRVHSRSMKPAGRIYHRDSPQGDRIVRNSQVVWLVMPLLQWEFAKTVVSRKDIVDEVRKYRRRDGVVYDRNGKEALLIQSYLEGSTDLHLRRTLDQYRHPNMTTDERDEDQVVYRYHRKKNTGAFAEHKLLVVDQIWLVVVDGIIITCCPESATDPKNDPLDTFEGIFADVLVGVGSRTEYIGDLIAAVISRCVGLFDRHYIEHGRRDLKFFELFEISVGLLTRRATLLQRRFEADLVNVTRWMNDRSYRPPPAQPINIYSHDDPDGDVAAWLHEDESEEQVTNRNPSFVNRLIDISKETKLHFESLDIDDELSTLSMILNTQVNVLKELIATFPPTQPDDVESSCSDDTGDDSRSHTSPTHTNRLGPTTGPWANAYDSVQKSLTMLDQHIADVDRLRTGVKEIMKLLEHLLTLKPRHASAIEARFARDQAEDTARQGEIILVFTIVTIIFLPLSFMAAFFAIPIAQFPRDSSTATYMPLGYVSKYVFGIGLGFSIALIAIAFIIGDIKTWVTLLKAWLDRRGTQRQDEWSPEPVGKRNTFQTTASWRQPDEAGGGHTKVDDDEKKKKEV